MTPEAQRIAIAEACGWTREKDEFDNLWWRSSEGQWAQEIPDYLNDLNAAMPLLGDDYDISSRNGIITVTIYIPSQEFDSRGEAKDLPKAICEAFLKTLGLWK